MQVVLVVLAGTVVVLAVLVLINISRQVAVSPDQALARQAQAKLDANAIVGVRAEDLVKLTHIVADANRLWGQAAVASEVYNVEEGRRVRFKVSGTQAGAALPGDGNGRWIPAEYEEEDAPQPRRRFVHGPGGY